MPVLIDGHNHVGVELQAYLRGHYPYAQSLAGMVAAGRALGVTHWVVFPMVTHFGMNLAALRRGAVEPDPRLESAPYAFENSRLLEELHLLCPHLLGRVFAFAMVDPLRATLEQADELRRLRERRPIYGLKMQASMLQAPALSLLAAGRVLLDLAEEWDVPFVAHTAVYPGDPWSQPEDLLRVAEAVPRVRFCLGHACRFDKPSLDRIAQSPNVWFDCSAHVIQCRLAAQGSPHAAPPARRFEADYTRPEQVLRSLAEAYPGKLVWGSDSPYYTYVDADLALWSDYAAEVACLHALAEPLRTAVGRRNALDCFRLPVEE
ncbi:MAG: amidohydrolase family protein [Armatimonadetes bacterium]|nr:amidohydrolase family protein [Armatimonadota bacterium]